MKILLKIKLQDKMQELAWLIMKNRKTKVQLSSKCYFC